VRRSRFPIGGTHGRARRGKRTRQIDRRLQLRTAARCQDEVPGEEQVRAAEVIAALSLATDLGIGVELEHGLHSTLFAMRLGAGQRAPARPPEGYLRRLLP
jgi:hypothetical protein